jgi:hypothetical protein
MMAAAAAAVRGGFRYIYSYIDLLSFSINPNNSIFLTIRLKLYSLAALED